MHKLSLTESTLAIGTEVMSHSRSTQSSSVSISSSLLCGERLRDDTGLAVVPTWFAVREHVPVESEKIYRSDEDLAQAEVLDEHDKNKVAVIKSTAD